MSDDKLAVNGGAAVRTGPFPARALFGEEEKAAAVALFDEAIAGGQAFGYNGPHEEAYQAAFAESLGGGFAKAVNSGTSAVLAAVAALELEPGAEVIVPPISDPGGVMPVAMMNCVPVPADGDGFSFNAGAEQIAAVMTERTKAIIIAHIMGEPGDMPAIMDLARQRGVPVIEDAAQAHAASVAGRPVGAWGELAAFSTMSGKHHATGAQGGVVFTKDEGLFWKARRFMDRGKPFGTDETSNVRLGLNLNSNELSAAIGLVQLGKLPGIVARRRAAAEAIFAGLAELQAVSPPRLVDDAVATYWYVRVVVDESKLTVDKTTFAEAVAAEGIPLGVSYGHLPSEHVWFRERRTYGTSGYPWPDGAGGAAAAKIDLPNAAAVIASSFILSVHENWTDAEVRDTLAAMKKVERAYLKA